jgi:hypothetical protein
MWHYVAVIVLLLCLSYAFARFSISSAALQFTIRSRLHNSNYEGFVVIDTDKTPTNVHILMSQIGEPITFEYHSIMGHNAYMFVHNNSLCERFTIPVPKALLGVLHDPVQLLDEQLTVTVSQVLDSLVATCIENNQVTTLTLNDGTSVVLCGENGFPSRVIGKQFDLHFTNIDPNFQSVKIHMETLMNGLSKCSIITKDVGDSPATINSSIKQNLWFLDYDETCKLDLIRHDAHCSTHVKATTDVPTKTCVFLHGVGQTLAEKGPPVTDQWPDYWGNVHTYTPQCKERIFIREETKSRGWNSRVLQQAYCDVALYGSRNSTTKDSIIRNSVLFVHSMGNLVLSAAIKNGYCDIDTNSTSWYQIMGPFDGTKVIGLLEDICKAAHTGEWPITKAKLYRYVADVGGYCVKGTEHAYPAYWTMRQQYCDIEQQICLDDLYSIAHSRIKGSMCGTSSFGIASRYSPMLKILSSVVDYGEDNDGMVPQSSCLKSSKGVDFQEDPKSMYYKTAINHADGTCRNGNSYFSGSASPCSYYTDKV